eukprot:1491837-Prymnesium_polylepis.1
MPVGRGARIVRMQLAVDVLVCRRACHARHNVGGCRCDRKVEPCGDAQVELEAVVLLILFVERGTRGQHLRVQEPLRALARELALLNEQNGEQHHLEPGEVGEVAAQPVQRAQPSGRQLCMEAEQHCDGREGREERADDDEEKVRECVHEARPTEWQQCRDFGERKGAVERDLEFRDDSDDAAREASLEKGRRDRCNNKPKLCDQKRHVQQRQP